ncbi:hypothetical protein UFOVP736_55 [uncultured Caudovirales phage]|uniref:AdoMet_MTases domain containing protein n=1 Tax=uncultured Caudovirales phage TaxID=2100421 RepID=A0A6J7X7B6_9CAUD|nr:hypothetical protein UFOVP705_26 [uncultured Caudovirales phage]CAB5224323.1 hypothetical protein UFOVP736_55 [uncultured Caudovirales phage]
MSQKRTIAGLASQATNSHLKGLQSYYTPHEWANALGALLPLKRPSIADLQCGNGSFLKGIQTPDTQLIYATEIDGHAPALATSHFPFSPHVFHSHIDFLDLLPCLFESRTRFDLLLCNPPFSLSWPIELLPLPLRNGENGAFMDSTRACLRAIPHLLSPDGECLFIANASTIARIVEKDPSALQHAWFHLTLPSFFPGADFTASILYFAKRYTGPLPAAMHLTPHSPDDLRVTLQSWHHLRPTGGLFGNYRDPARFQAALAEAQARINPHQRTENVILARDGKLRTRVTSFQRYLDTISPAQFKALQSLNNANPYELTVQRATRQALAEMLADGHWTISPDAAAAIRAAMDEYHHTRTPLTPVSQLQRLGWLDENDHLLCTQDFLFFRAGTRYEVTSEVAKYDYSHYKPRYKDGKKSEEQLLTRGNDLIFTIHCDEERKAQFTYKHKHIAGTYPMEDIEKHFAIPDVPHIANVQSEAFAAHLKRLVHLEHITS